MSAVASCASEIEIPEMIAISESVSIMKGEVTVGLFNQVMEGYESPVLMLKNSKLFLLTHHKLERL